MVAEHGTQLFYHAVYDGTGFVQIRRNYADWLHKL